MIRIGALALLAGCGGAIGVVLEGGEKLNPTREGKATPVNVSLFQLKSDTAFGRADFEDLWRRDAETLKDDRLEKIEKTLFPGQELKFEIKKKDGAWFIGVFGAFSDPSKGPWKYLVSLEKESEVRLRLDEHRIEKK